MNDRLPTDPTRRVLPPSARRRRRLLMASGAVVLAVAVAWFGAGWLGGLFKTKPSLARMTGNPIPVTVAQVTREQIAEVIGGPTLGRAFLGISITTAVSEGRVSKVNTDLGKLVTAGDILLEFDTTVFREALERGRLQVEMARADLQKVVVERKARLQEMRDAVAAAKERLGYRQVAESTAATAHQRSKALWENGVIALAEFEQVRVKWDEAKSALALARLELRKAEDELKNEAVTTRALIEAARFKLGAAAQELAQARRNMENTAVKAPNAGAIAERSVNPGEWVRNGKPLFVLDIIDPIYGVGAIEQEKMPYVSLQQAAEVVFDSYPTTVFRGKIAKIDQTVDPSKRTFSAFVLLDNPSFQLRPGMAAFTRIQRSRRVTLVPRLAVINPSGAPSIDATVFVVDGSTVVARKVKLGKPEGLGRVEVLSGVDPGEWVVIHGQKDLNPGDRVAVTKWPPVPNERPK